MPQRQEDNDAKAADAASTPDRGGLLTERRHPQTMSLDTCGVEECVRLLNAQDATAHEAVAAAIPAISRFIEEATARLADGGRLVYVGAGTSGRLCVLDAAECPPTFQTPPEMVVALIAGGDAALRSSSESQEDHRDGAHEKLETLDVRERDAVLGVAAGGTTPYVLGALEEAHRRGALTGLLVCSPMARPASADHLIVVATGPEALTGSTRLKAGTATKLVLNTITTTIMVQLGKVYENLMVDLRATNDKLRDRAIRIVMELTNLEREEASALLKRAGGDVKTAVVMKRRRLTRELAQRRLTASDGRLRSALEPGDEA